MTRGKKKQKDETPKAGANALGMVPSYVKRIESLEGERKELGSDIKDIYAEAKGAGLNPKGLKALVSERKRDKKQAEELEQLLSAYRTAMEAANEVEPIKHPFDGDTDDE